MVVLSIHRKIFIMIQDSANNFFSDLPYNYSKNLNSLKKKHNIFLSNNLPDMYHESFNESAEICKEEYFARQRLKKLHRELFLIPVNKLDCHVILRDFFLWNLSYFFRTFGEQSFLTRLTRTLGLWENMFFFLIMCPPFGLNLGE